MRTRILALLLLPILALASCARGVDAPAAASAPTPAGALTLDYATQFSVERFSDGYALVHVADGRDYALVPEGRSPSPLGSPNATIVTVPCDRLYLAASSAGDLLRALDALDRIACCSTSAENYAVPELRRALESGAIRYVGKYSAPEYETLLSEKCRLAIESTMVYHTPKVREQLERLGIPTLIERSNYETEPLGRLEWIKLYGLLLGQEEEAFAVFERAKRTVDELTTKLDAGESRERKRVAFFYVSSNGYVNVHKPGDYVCKMIELAGGRNALDGLALEPERVSALSTVNVDWEAFYQQAVDADALIYNGSIDGGMTTLAELIAKNELFKEFKAVKTGNVWSTSLNMYQESSRIADAIVDFKLAIDGDESRPLRYLTRLK